MYVHVYQNLQLVCMLCINVRKKLKRGGGLKLQKIFCRLFQGLYYVYLRKKGEKKPFPGFESVEVCRVDEAYDAEAVSNPRHTL